MGRFKAQQRNWARLGPSCPWGRLRGEISRIPTAELVNSIDGPLNCELTGDSDERSSEEEEEMAESVTAAA